jgi:ABC-2 type transport system ATP-binding protein
VDQIVIDIANLTKSFGSKAVLRGVDLRVPQGAVVGLVGRNGSGKSTLLKCLLGLLDLDAGQARLLGCNSDQLTPEVKARLGYVPQVVRLLGWMKVRHMILYTASFYENWDDHWVDQLVQRWRVPLDQRVQHLSSGQLQTLAIVLALAHRPEVLILDEPAASLDPVARRDFLTSVLELASDGQRTAMFSTHIISDLERIATHVANLRNGRIAHFSELDELKDSVKRLRLFARGGFPLEFEIPGALRTQVEGNLALAAVSNVTPELVDEIRDLWNADVRVEDLNLEEIFVELNGHE